MRYPLLLLLSLLTLAAPTVLQVTAQDVPPLPEEETPAATVVAQQESPDPFLLTATEIIRQATLAATARGTSGAPPTLTPSPFSQTVTDSPDTTPIPELSAQSEAGDNTDDDPLMATFIAFGTLLLILVVFGYVVVNASNMPEGRNR